MMKRKNILWLFLCTLLLSGCQLARPEAAESQEDRFCGYYVVPYARSSDGYWGDDFYDNPNLTAYGTDSVQLDGFGSFSFDREVLFADREAGGHRIVFPGMSEGYSMIWYTYTDENGNHVNAFQTDMAPDEEGVNHKVTDEGQEVSFGGVIYGGPPVGAPENWREFQPDTVWTAYRVYETEDDRIYIDGTGNSFGNGSGISFWEEHTSSYSENGETVESFSITAKLSFREAPRLERLTVYQYGADNVLLRADDMPLQEDIPPLTCQSGATWVVVEEVNPHGVTHTAYDLTEEGVSHSVVILDDAGVGRYTELQIMPR